MVDIVGTRNYVEVPGEKIYELPPLLLKQESTQQRMDDLLSRAESIVENDALLADTAGGQVADESSLRQHQVGMAMNLADHYARFLKHWAWGESIVEWIRQCEITFDAKPNLRSLLRTNVWPHAGRSSFVTLLNDKKVSHDTIDLENSVGYRLTFRQPPPIDFFSDQYLFFLNSSLAANAYQKWVAASGEPVSSLPPERFQFMIMGSDFKEV